MVLDSRMQNKSFQFILDNFLLGYRTSPCIGINKSPSELMLSFKPKSLIDNIKYDKGGKEIGSKFRENANNRIDRNDNTNGECKTADNSKKEKIKTFRVGETVLYRNVFNNYCKWLTCIIVQILSNIRYVVNINGAKRQAHIDQLRKLKSKPVKFSPFVSYKAPSSQP